MLRRYIRCGIVGLAVGGCAHGGSLAADDLPTLASGDEPRPANLSLYTSYGPLRNFPPYRAANDNTASTDIPLFRPAPRELFRTTGPGALRKEYGFHVSTDGRIAGYASAADGYGGEPSGIAGVDQPAMNAAEYAHSRGLETPEMNSLFTQLKGRGLNMSLDDGWKIRAGARNREYSSSALNSRVGQLALVRQWGSYAASFALQAEKRGSWNMAPSQSAELSYAATPRSTLAVAYTTGREYAFFGSQGMLNTEVRAIAFRAEHRVERDWSMSLDAGYYDHGGLAAHKAMRFAFRRDL